MKTENAIRRRARRRGLPAVKIKKPCIGSPYVIPTERSDRKGLSPNTTSAIDIATSGDDQKLIHCDPTDAYILGFARAWAYFTNPKAGRSVFNYLDETL